MGSVAGHGVEPGPHGVDGSACRTGRGGREHQQHQGVGLWMGETPQARGHARSFGRPQQRATCSLCHHHPSGGGLRGGLSGSRQQPKTLGSRGREAEAGPPRRAGSEDHSPPLQRRPGAPHDPLPGPRWRRAPVRLPVAARQRRPHGGAGMATDPAMGEWRGVGLPARCGDTASSKLHRPGKRSASKPKRASVGLLNRDSLRTAAKR